MYNISPLRTTDKTTIERATNGVVMWMGWMGRSSDVSLTLYNNMHLVYLFHIPST